MGPAPTFPPQCYLPLSSSREPRDLVWGSLTTLWSEGKGSMSCSAIEYSESLATAQAPSLSCLLTAPTQSPTKESWVVTPRPRHPQALELPPLERPADQPCSLPRAEWFGKVYLDQHPLQIQDQPEVSAADLGGAHP